MPNPSHRTWTLLVVACLVWHALTLGSAYRQAHRDKTARDFASYYYAVQVAASGGDPYDKSALQEASRQDPERRGGVHPFFYPPPYLLTMVWVRPLEALTAYRVWFWLDEIMALMVVGLLWRWWRPLGRGVPVVLALTLAAFTALPNNHLMGQMNLPPLWLTLWALREAEAGRDLRAGAAMGLACMMKMSPALFVMWWLLRGRWRAAVASVVAAAVLSLATLPLVGVDVQWRFYTEVLPGFASGRYNGLAVGIDLFGNHGLPNLYDGWFPAGDAHLSLSSTARMLSTGTMLALLGASGWAFRRAPADLLATAGQIGAVGCVMLLVPVYTYEHHLVWAWPAVVVSVVAVTRRRLGVAWAPLLGAAVAIWCADLAELKEMSLYVQDGAPALAAVLRELKSASLVTLLVASGMVGRSEGVADGG